MVVQPVIVLIMLFKVVITIENPVDCKLCAIISILSAKKCTAVDIHNKLCVMYGNSIMIVLFVPGWTD